MRHSGLLCREGFHRLALFFRHFQLNILVFSNTSDANLGAKRVEYSIIGGIDRIIDAGKLVIGCLEGLRLLLLVRRQLCEIRLNSEYLCS